MYRALTRKYLVLLVLSSCHDLFARSSYSHFSLVRTISGKEKNLYYRELLVSEKFFKTRWIPLVLPSPVILGEKKFYYRELLVSEKFLNNTGFPLWFYSLRRVSGLFWAKSIIHVSFFFKFIHWFKIFLRDCPIARC